MVHVRLPNCCDCGKAIRTVDNEGVYVVNGFKYCGRCYNKNWAGP